MERSDGERRGCVIVLDHSPSPGENVFRDTALPFSGSTYRPEREAVPERIREMRSLYEYGRETLEAKAKNFCRQGRFMQDYEDEWPWTGEFVRYFPTYHDLTTGQLRGYFSWRTLVRSGEYRPVPASVAYLYLYELLNGIGAESPADSLRKMREFEEGFLDSGAGDEGIRKNLRRWMLEYAVVNDLPPETAREAADPDLLREDLALTVLRRPEEYSDEELFEALCRFGGKKLPESPVLTADPVRGRHLFCETWRIAADRSRQQEKDLFTRCFGDRTVRRWYPLANAVYVPAAGQRDRDYELDGCRIFRCRGSAWQVEAYEKSQFDRERFQGLLHEADARLRRRLKTGRLLREKPENAWAAEYVDAAIEAERRALAEAARPKIEIALSELERIRRDARITRDSLLTEEEPPETEPAEEEPVSAAESPAELPDLPLDPVQVRILRALLRGDSAGELLRAGRLMPSLVADAINEALFDEIGDTVLLCEDERLSVVEDYRDELTQILGEDRHD